MLERLHDDGCARDKASNRELHFDQYCKRILLYMFNPVISSLRAIQQASELKKVQRKLGCSRASLGSLSESARVFYPELLREIIAELGQRLEPVARDKRRCSGSRCAKLSHLTHRAHAKRINPPAHQQPALENHAPQHQNKTRAEQDWV